MQVALHEPVAVSDVRLGWFDPVVRSYRPITLCAQVEVLSLIGDAACAGDQPQLHAHVVVGDSEGIAHGGHLLEAHVRPTLEVVLVETPAHLRRRPDPATGLALIRLE
jgi:predicted DNA-binding protein with PD1-like motif